jgi:hypothetical protein
MKEKMVVQQEKKYEQKKPEKMSSTKGDRIERTENHVQSRNCWKGQWAPLP